MIQCISQQGKVYEIYFRNSSPIIFFLELVSKINNFLPVFFPPCYYPVVQRQEWSKAGRSQEDEGTGWEILGGVEAAAAGGCWALWGAWRGRVGASRTTATLYPHVLLERHRSRSYSRPTFPLTSLFWVTFSRQNLCYFNFSPLFLIAS